MLIFEATDQMQGQRDSDYHHARNTELVYLPPIDCSDSACGCKLGFAGFDSHRATTTAMVVERPDMDIQELCRQLAASLHDGGWIDSTSPDHELVAMLADEIVQLATRYGEYGVGTVIERDGNDLMLRLTPEQRAEAEDALRIMKHLESFGLPDQPTD